MGESKYTVYKLKNNKYVISEFDAKGIYEHSDCGEWILVFGYHLGIEFVTKKQAEGFIRTHDCDDILRKNGVVIVGRF